MSIEQARDIILEIFENNFGFLREEFLLKNKKGRRLGETYEKVCLVYLGIAWFIENKRLSRSEAADLFNRSSSISSRAIKFIDRMIENRDIKFDETLFKFNTCLEDRGLPCITMDYTKIYSKIRKISKDEAYHIKFMIEKGISDFDIAKHFKTNEFTISNFRNNIN